MTFLFTFKVTLLFAEAADRDSDSRGVSLREAIGDEKTTFWSVSMLLPVLHFTGNNFRKKSKFSIFDDGISDFHFFSCGAGARISEIPKRFLFDDRKNDRSRS